MTSTRVFGLALSILMLSSTLTGCLGLAVQREFMESIRDEPIVRNTEETVGFDYTFESNSQIQFSIQMKQLLILMTQSLN